MSENKIQKIGVSAFVFKNNTVLLLKRSKNEDPFPEYWELPGGKIEFGETTEDALKRELLEEAGINIEVIKPYGCFSYIFNKKHYIDIQFICHALGDKITLSPEHEEYRWAYKDEFNQLKISPEMKSAVKIGFENL